MTMDHRGVIWGDHGYGGGSSPAGLEVGAHSNPQLLVVYNFDWQKSVMLPFYCQ